MSLKAKLEAVIYAAEEPVSLAQLTVLFAEEALLWKAAGEEQDVLALDGVRDTISVAVAQQPEAGGDDRSSTAGPLPDSDLELEARRQARTRERAAREILRGMLAELMADYAADGRGIEIREIAGGYRMGTKPEMHDAVRAFVKSQKPPMKLSLPALETLAVIAYKQPVTAPEVGEIRGVDSAGVLGSLMSRKLIATAGRKQVVGRPMLYKTTKEFLLRFGLKDVSELPSMEEFEKMAALELSEESLDEETAEPEEAVESSGELFVAVEESALKDAAREIGAFDRNSEISIPSAEALQGAAEADASVARQHAHEIEEEQ